MDLNRKGNGEKVGNMKKGETITSIYYMRKKSIYFQKKGKKIKMGLFTPVSGQNWMIVKSADFHGSYS